MESDIPLLDHLMDAALAPFHPAEPDPPFAAFRAGLPAQTPLRAAITAAYRRPEADCVAALLDLAALPPEAVARAKAAAGDLENSQNK